MILQERTGPTPPISRLLTRAHRIFGKIRRHLHNTEKTLLTLSPRGEQRGRVLYSYILDPFVRPQGERFPLHHTHYWESWALAQGFVDRGYEVDVVSWNNHSFVPKADYDFAMDVRFNLARWAPHLPEKCVKILHIDSAHWRVNNGRQNERLAALEARRGFSVAPVKQVPEHRGIEEADLATVLGNEFTQASYGFAGKPLFRLPISTTMLWDPPQNRDFSKAREHFLWFGSGGLVHKGLDVVLEAFSGLQNLHLYVAGPVGGERDFETAYHRELYDTPNIHPLGFVDLESSTFEELRRRCAFLIYPTCSEGGGGSVITTMHAGLIPMVPKSASVDLASDYAIVLQDPTVENLRKAALSGSQQDPDNLKSMSLEARKFAREHHTREHFSAAWSRVLDRLMDGSWREEVP